MKSKKILVVDDDQFLVEVLIEKLASAGFSSKGLYSGQEALEEVERSIPDLIILDLIMPGMNGLEVLQKLKSSEKTKDIPVLVLTHLADSEVISQIKEGGGSGYLVKDNQNTDEIIEAIKNII